MEPADLEKGLCPDSSARSLSLLFSLSLRRLQAFPVPGSKAGEGLKQGDRESVEEGEEGRNRDEKGKMPQLCLTLAYLGKQLWSSD